MIFGAENIHIKVVRREHLVIPIQYVSEERGRVLTVVVRDIHTCNFPSEFFRFPADAVSAAEQFEKAHVMI